MTAFVRCDINELNIYNNKWLRNELIFWKIFELVPDFYFFGQNGL